MTKSQLLLISILTVSVTIQAWAAIMAARLIGITGRLTAWGLVALALALMAVRRAVPLFHLISGDVSRPPDVMSEIIALAISIIIAVGIQRIAPLFQVRIRTEEELRRTAAEIQNLYDHAPCGYHSLNRDGIFIRMNETELQWLGYGRDEIIGKKRFADMLTAESLATFNVNFAPFKERGWVRDLEFEFIRKDGSTFPALLSATAIYDDSDNYLMSRATVYDITERKRTEDVLSISEERYRKAQAIGHVGNWEYNLQTEQFWGSDEAKRIYGFDPKQANFSTDDVENCIPERKRVHQALVDLIQEGKPYRVEFEIRPLNSSEPKNILSIAELQRDEHGEPLKVIGVIQDITEQKRTENELRRLNEELEHRVKERTAELERKNKDLEKLNKLFVGRELRMAELKNQIRKLNMNRDGMGDTSA